jgi:hypothetical protein
MTIDPVPAGMDGLRLWPAAVACAVRDAMAGREGTVAFPRIPGKIKKREMKDLQIWKI